MAIGNIGIGNTCKLATFSYSIAKHGSKVKPKTPKTRIEKLEVPDGGRPFNSVLKQSLLFISGDAGMLPSLMAFPTNCRTIFQQTAERLSNKLPNEFPTNCRKDVAR